MANKVSEAQRRANVKWDKKNPQTVKYSQYKARARTFVLSAKDEDIATIEEWLDERKTNGKKTDGPLS